MFQDTISTAMQAVGLENKPVHRASQGTLLPWDELPSILSRRKWWIVGSVLAVLAAALALNAALPRIYTASTQLLVQPVDLNAVDHAVNQVAPQGDNSVAQVETAARIVGSTKVLERAVEKAGLATDPEFNPSPSELRQLVARLRQQLHFGTEPVVKDPMDEAVRALTKHLTIRRSERTYVIEVAVTSNDPVKAARIANAVADAFFEVQSSARADATRRISDSLTSRLGELQDRVRVGEDAVQKYKAANNLATANGQLVNEQQITEASAQLLVAQNRTADAKAKLGQIDAAANGRDLGAIPESLQSPTITELRGQLAQISRAEADALTTYGARHPLLTQLRSQVADVQRSLNEEVRRIRATARIEYDRARTSEENLRSNLERLQSAGTRVNAAQVRLRELERDAEASRSVYEAFLVRARETAEQERVDTFNAWVMSPAVPPADRSFPPSTTIILGLALLLGTVAGIALGLLRERLDQRLWTRDRIESVTGLPVLATFDAPRRWQALPASRRSEIGPYGAPVDLPRNDPRNEDAMRGLVQEFFATRSPSDGRMVLLVGDRRENDVALVAQGLASAASMEGRKATVVRFGEDGPDHAGGAQGYRAANETKSFVDSPAADGTTPSIVDFPEIRQIRQLPGAIDRLKACIAGRAGHGLTVIASRGDSIAIPQLAELADASILVLSKSRTTRGEALAMLQRLKLKSAGLRGSVLVRRV